MVVTSKFRRAPDTACSFFTIANIHINNVCAKHRSVCISLLLLIRDCSSVQSRLPATSTRPSSGSSQLENPMDNAVSRRLTWPSITSAPRGRHSACRPCGAPVQSLTATSVLTVAALLCSRPAVPVVDHAPRANIGLGPEDKTWHCEQWLPIKFAGLKRRRDATPAGSKSWQRVVPYHSS